MSPKTAKRPIAAQRTLFVAQAGMKRDIKAMFSKMSNDLAALALRYAGGADRPISTAKENTFLSEAGNIVSRYFVGVDGRSAFGTNGIVALAPFPAILNKWIYRTTKLVIDAHSAWMRRTLPEDVIEYLSRKNTKRRQAEFRVQEDKLPKELEDLMRALRIFHNDPLAEYEPAHTWVDPAGYRLSDRVWKASNATRSKIDAMLSDAIREGWSAEYLSKQLEKFLLPGRVGKRTTRPYGRDASYDCMRLARTELTRAHSEASYIAAYSNPYVNGVDWALSASHPKRDICDQLCTIGKDGQRVKPPYDFASRRIPPAHPHCLCVTRPAVIPDAALVTEKLRTVMRDARTKYLEPYLTPVQADDFIADLLGDLVLEAISPQRILL